MDASGIALLVFFVSVFVVFGAVLGWVSWEESTISRRKNRT
jgi:hypothetical protein